MSSDRKSFPFLDSNGCEVDAHFLEVPDYSRFQEQVTDTSQRYVYQEMSVFKFPGESNVVFQCKISFCDMTSTNKCVKMLVSDL